MQTLPGMCVFGRATTRSLKQYISPLMPAVYVRTRTHQPRQISPQTAMLEPSAAQIPIRSTSSSETVWRRRS